jgi:hypothetical protein
MKADTMQDASGFRLSRIRAEGWNAARNFPLGGEADEELRIAALNPYHSEREREYWYLGFNSALNRS